MAASQACTAGTGSPGLTAKVSASMLVTAQPSLKVLVVEDVEHAAVDDGVERQAELGKAQRAGDLEAGLQAPCGRLAARGGDGPR